MNALAAERRDADASPGHVLAEAMGSPVAAKALAALIDEDGRGGRGIDAPPGEEIAEDGGSLGPEGADAVLVALPVQAHEVGLREVQIAGVEVERLLDTVAAVVDEREETVVAQAAGVGPVDRGEHRLQFVALIEIGDRAVGGHLRRDRAQALALLEGCRDVGSDDAEERADGRMPGTFA